MSRTSQIYGHLGVIFGLGGGGSGWQLRIMKVAEKKEEDTEKTKNLETNTYLLTVWKAEDGKDEENIENEANCENEATILLCEAW